MISLTEIQTINNPFLFTSFRLVNSGGGLSQEYQQATAECMQWGPIKGMRNLVAHNYGSMSRDIIWETASVDIPALKRFYEDQLSSEH